MKLISKKDIIIPKGTIFERIDGTMTHYAFDNYETILALDKDTCAIIVVSSENVEYFETKYEFAKNPRFRYICHNTQENT